MVHTRIRLLRHVVPFDLRIHERCRGLRSIAVEHLDSATHGLHVLLRHGLAVSRSAYVASDMARTLASAQESLARIVRGACSRTRSKLSGGGPASAGGGTRRASACPGGFLLEPAGLRFAR